MDVEGVAVRISVVQQLVVRVDTVGGEDSGDGIDIEVVSDDLWVDIAVDNIVDISVGVSV